MSHYRQAAQWLTELAMQTDKDIVLVNALIERLRQQLIILPALNAVERAGADAVTRANRAVSTKRCPSRYRTCTGVALMIC